MLKGIAVKQGLDGTLEMSGGRLHGSRSPGRHPCGRASDRQGQSLVEVAVVLPVVLLLISAVIDFSRIYNAQYTLHRITNEAVNYGTLMKGAGDFPSRTDVQTRLLTAVPPPLSAASVIINSVQVHKPDSEGRESVAVDVSYDVPILTPLMSWFFSDGNARVSSKAQRSYLFFSGQPTLQSLPPPPPPPPFTIASTNDVLINVNCSARLKIVGTQIQAGNGQPVLMTAKLSTNGNSFGELFSGNPLQGGEDVIVSSLMAGSKVAVSARAFAPGLINKSYRSNEKNSFQDSSSHTHQYVLANGDSLPPRPGFSGQTPLFAFLAPFVDTGNSMMVLGRKEVAVLFEFNSTFNSPAADFQDLVVLLQFYDPATESPPMVP